MSSLGRTHRLSLLVATLLLSLYLLLVLDTIQFHSRAMFALWNIAHVPLFILLTFVFDQALVRHHPRSVYVWLTLLCPPLIMFAIGTEWMQSMTVRQPSVYDALMNILGVCLAVLWLWAKNYCTPNTRRWIHGLLLLVFLALFVKPAQMSVADYYRVKAFPVLSDFEHWSDPMNWSAGERTKEVAKSGHYSLQVILPAESYSGASLRYFPREWHDYTILYLSVFNPGNAPLPLSLRVHDRQHRKSGEAYNDRYNLNFNAQPGWNDLRIPLEKIAHAAQSRIISLDEINAIRVFYQGIPPDGTVFYIDDVRLEK